MVRMLRDGSLEKLKRRATFDACDALARAELRLPQYRWLRFHFDEAEVLACAYTWEAQSPRDIIAMASDSKKRFIESSQQLLDLILESLSHCKPNCMENSLLWAISGILRAQIGGQSKRKMCPTMWRVI